MDQRKKRKLRYPNDSILAARKMKTKRTNKDGAVCNRVFSVLCIVDNALFLSIK